MNGRYVKGREKFLRGEIAWHTDDIVAVLIDTADYTADLDGDEFLSDIPLAGRVATVSLTAKTTTTGWAGSGDITFPAATGDISEAMVIVHNTGDAATSPLIAYLDAGTNLPVTPNGADITVIIDPATGLFRL